MMSVKCMEGVSVGLKGMDNKIVCCVEGLKILNVLNVFDNWMVDGYDLIVSSGNERGVSVGCGVLKSNSNVLFKIFVKSEGVGCCKQTDCLQSLSKLNWRHRVVAMMEQMIKDEKAEH